MAKGNRVGSSATPKSTTVHVHNSKINRSETNFEIECTLSGFQGFILRVSRAIGVAPLHFVKTKDGWRIRVSRAHSICSIALMIILVFLLILISLVFDLPLPGAPAMNAHNNSSILWTVDISIVCTVALVAASTGFNRMRCCVDCIAKLQKINKELDSYVYKQQSFKIETRKRLLFYILTGLQCLNVTVDMIYKILNYNYKGSQGFTPNFVQYILYKVLCLTLDFFALNFMCITMSVLPPLCTINNCLMELVQEAYNNSNKSFLQPYPKKAINKFKLETSQMGIRQITKSYNRVEELTAVTKDIRRMPPSISKLLPIYCSLSNIVRRIDEDTGVMLVLYMLTFVVHNMIIRGFYFIIKFAELFGSGEILQLTWTAYHIAKFLLVVEVCQRTYEQMDLTQHRLKQAVRYSPVENYSFISEVRRFYQHTKLNQVSYSPMQLFTVNRSLSLTITASITTYLVVIIQFL